MTEDLLDSYTGLLQIIKSTDFQQRMSQLRNRLTPTKSVTRKKLEIPEEPEIVIQEKPSVCDEKYQFLKRMTRAFHLNHKFVCAQAFNSLKTKLVRER